MRQRGELSWELRVYLGTDPETGRRRYASRTVRGTKRAAQAALVELVEQASVAPSVGARSTVAKLLGEWVAAASPNWSASTVRQVESVVRRHLGPRLGHVFVAELTTAQIDACYGELRRSGLSAGTVRRIHGVLHAALAQAMRWDWIWINPAATASPPRTMPTEMLPPTPEVVSVLIEKTATRNPALAVFLRLAASTGARRSQLLGLRWRDVDLDLGTLSLIRGVVEGPHGPVLAPTKTGRTCQVTLDADTLTAVRKHAERCTMQAGDGFTLDAFVFSHDSHGAVPWRPNWVTKAFIDARRVLGLPHFRLHDLRHFMATEMLNAGVAIPTVSARLSHPRNSTTLNYYAHAVPSGDLHAAETIAAILDEAGSAPIRERVELRSAVRAELSCALLQLPAP